MHIFTDTSVNPSFNIAVGGYLILDDLSQFSLENLDSKLIKDNLKSQINYIQFESRSSTIAEMMTIQYVLQSIENSQKSITLYTDCYNFVELVTIRKCRTNDLYTYLIDTTDRLNINVIWTKGHSKAVLKTEIHQKIFTLVDRQARKILRSLVKGEHQTYNCDK